MRKLFPAVLLALALAPSAVLAQAPDTESAADTAGTGSEAESSGQEKGAAPEREETKTPELRDGYQPREELSRDKGAAFPADI